MKDTTPKVDDTPGATGEESAAEYNDFKNDVQNALIESGQTLTATLGENNRQTLIAISAGGKSIVRGTGETALLGEIVEPDNGGGAVTIILPPFANLFFGATVVIRPRVGTFYSVNPVTLDRNGSNIMSDADDVILNSTNADNKIFKFTFKDVFSGWEISFVGQLGENP